MQMEVDFFDLGFSWELSFVISTAPWLVSEMLWVGSALGFGTAQVLTGLEGKRSKIQTAEKSLQKRIFYWHLLYDSNSEVSVLDDHAGQRFKISFAVGSAQMLEEASAIGRKILFLQEQNFSSDIRSGIRASLKIPVGICLNFSNSASLAQCGN